MSTKQGVVEAGVPKGTVMSQVAGPWIRDSFRWQWKKKRSTHLYRGHIQVAPDPLRGETHTHTWLMADGTCYAILTAGVWEATSLTHRQVISAWCRKEPEACPQKTYRLLRFRSWRKAKRAFARLQLWFRDQTTVSLLCASFELHPLRHGLLPLSCRCRRRPV